MENKVYIKKVLTDRLNTLKSNLSDLRKPKLGKRGYETDELILEGKIEEITWLLAKLK